MIKNNITNNMSKIEKYLTNRYGNIFVFTINYGPCEGNAYSVYLVNEFEDKNFLGATDYEKCEILIKYNKLSVVLKTFMHELTHVYLYETGHNQSEKEFNNEDVCEIVANSYNFVNKSLVEFISNLSDIANK